MLRRTMARYGLVLFMAPFFRVLECPFHIVFSFFFEIREGLQGSVGDVGITRVGVVVATYPLLYRHSQLKSVFFQ